MTGSPPRRLVALAVPALLVTANAASGQDTVNIANWSDYIGETTLQDFTAETGITPNYDVYGDPRARRGLDHSVRRPPRAACAPGGGGGGRR